MLCMSETFIFQYVNFAQERIEHIHYLSYVYAFMHIHTLFCLVCIPAISLMCIHAH